MAIKAAEAVDLPLTLFGGLDTSLKATDLPEGLSPANNDVVFGPGFVASRPCLRKLFNAAFPGAPRVVSEHLMMQANQQPLNLYLDSLGVLRKEDPTNNPNAYTTIGNVVPGSMMKAVTVDGRCFQAFSDGIHGIDIPRQFDGTNWDRLTQDGPATPPTVADVTTTVAITSITGLNTLAIATISEEGNTVTVVTTTPHGLSVGDPVYIYVAAGSQYRADYFVQSVQSATSFTVVQPNFTGIAAAAAGHVQPNLVTVVTGAPHGLHPGDFVTISGSPTDNYNNGKTFADPNADIVINPASFIVVSVPSPTSFVTSVQLAVPGATLGGTAAIGGLISPGRHQVCVSFLLSNGDITKPSPTSSWICGGFRQAQVTNIPIGPSNTVARILFFTGAGGANFFWIPVDVTATALPSVSGGGFATVVRDNTSTTAIVDFSDNALFAGLGIDIPGNNLFNQVTLGPCIGVDSYASRLFVWGEFNKVQSLLNMGFEGGTAAVAGTNPLGWDVSGNVGGTLVNSPVDFGLAWQITGDGTAAAKGKISQSAYRDYLNQSILDVSTQYSFYVWAKASAAGLAGSLVATLSSASTGFSATATIPINQIPNAAGAFVHADFTLPTPGTIPSDLLLTINTTNLNNLATVTIDEMMMVFTEQPYRDTVMRGSYVNNFAAFDGVTGDIGPESDPNPIRCTFELLEQFSILTGTSEGCRHTTRDNDGEPGTWQVNKIDKNVGAASIFCATTGPNWAMWLSDTGKALALRITAGGQSFKISREMKTDFRAVNMEAKQTAWITNVDDDSRVYMGIPQGDNTSPSVMAVLDYFESDTAEQIDANRPLKIGFTGKMLTTDLGRKWTTWKLALGCGQVLARGDGTNQFVVGAGAAFGNVYVFDDTKLTDDDYGAMAPAYTTYFFVNHEMEQQLPLGIGRKYYSALTTFIAGVGYLQIQPNVNKLGNYTKNIIDPAKPYVLIADPDDDQEWSGLDVDARRCAFTISVKPLAGTTDVQFVLSHLGVRIQKHPVSPQAGVTR